MAKKLNVQLNARVYLKSGKRARCPHVTEIVIRLGDMPVAHKSLGGRYNEAQALAEFKKDPRSFKRLAGWDMAWSCGAVA
jgi:hypothetical protein